MDKITGQQLKKDLEAVRLKEKNLLHKINKLFDLIVSDYTQYLSGEHKRFLEVSFIPSIGTEHRLEIIIQTKANYVKANGNQVEMF